VAEKTVKKENVFTKIGGFFRWIGNDIKAIGTTFKEGDWRTRVSYLIPGFGQLTRGQFVVGLFILAIEALLLWFIIGFGWQYLKDIATLGTQGRTTNPDGTVTYGDNSFFILLWSIVTIIAILAYLLIWRINLASNKKEQNLLKEGKKLPSNKDAIKSLFDENFDKTLLALPCAGIFVFTVVPIIFMICVAFTNFDATHQPPSKLFTWVGFENFKNLMSIGGGTSASFSKTFGIILAWTLVWAFFATFLNYFVGMAIAILINKKGIKFKKLWRTILVLTIAVPQFVSFLYVSKMFAADGLINMALMRWGWIQEAIPFWTNKNYARVLVILINLWCGVPYTMLIVTGLLMNIPADLYESAKIDGATGWQMFAHITLPYMLFVTGPFLLTQFTFNLNNFNTVYLLTQGGPKSIKLNGGAGYTDILITWLYKLTVNDTNYKMAAVIGIMVFVVVAGVSLIVYNMLPSVKDEEGFQ